MTKLCPFRRTDPTLFTPSATYYVDATGGDDDNAGTIEAPWQTLAKVYAVRASLPGCYVLFKSGETFSAETWTVPTGSSGSPIRLGAYGTGALPIIAAKVFANSYVCYSGLHFVNAGTAEASYCWGTAAAAVRNSYLYNCRFQRTAGTGASYSHPIALYYGIASTTFDRCTFEPYTADVKQNCWSATTWGQAADQIHDVTLKGCTFKAGGRIGLELTPRTGANPYEYPVYNFNVRGCTFESMGASGISYGGGGNGEDGNSVLEDCTFADCGTRGNETDGCHGIELTGFAHMVVRNNSVAGSYVKNMLNLTGNASDVLVEGNTFDGTLSQYSGFCIEDASDVTLTNNTIITSSETNGNWCEIKNATGIVSSGNVYKSLMTNGSIGTWRAALRASGTTTFASSGDSFYSKKDPGCVYVVDTASASFADGDFYFDTDTGNRFYVGAGATKTESGSTDHDV